MKMLNADCDRICVENPTPSKRFNLPIHSQVIEPYFFGDKAKKRTCLWLKNLPPLIPTDIVTDYSPTTELGNWYNTGGKERQKNRSKIFWGVARAMAAQWGGDLDVH